MKKASELFYPEKFLQKMYSPPSLKKKKTKFLCV